MLGEKGPAPLPTGTDSRLIPIQLDSTSDLSALAAVSQLREAHGLNHIDLVIANAGIGSGYGMAAQADIEAVKRHFDVNALGPLRLFQSMRSLLQGSAGTPRFVCLSTSVASMSLTPTIPLQSTVYGSSKAALNYIVRRIHVEEDWLVAFSINPG